jgi:transposase
MPGRVPSPISLSAKERELLDQIIRATTSPQREVVRARIILECDAGLRNRRVAEKLQVSQKTVRLWRDRFSEAAEALAEMESKGDVKALRTRVHELLSDAHRCGAPPKFSAEEVCQIVALACETPDGKSERPVSHWTHRELADEAVSRSIIESISVRHVGRLLKEADIKPHLSRYWLNANPKDPKAYEAEVIEVCTFYSLAPQLYNTGVHVVSTDEMTGIQALERKYATKPVKPGVPERREYEYIRHGTTCLIANWHVALGRILAPSVGPTRTEKDYVAHIRNTVATDPEARWVFIHDQLNTHQSQSLVRFVVETEKLDVDLGKKGKSGILKSISSRKAFLADPSHRIRFVCTPKHSSWLNQIEIWFSILVRRLLRRGSFTSVEDLQQRILAFIDYFNKTMAGPFRWTYGGRALAVPADTPILSRR